MGAGLLIACTFFIFGGFASKFIGIPGAIIMIFSALVKYFKLMPAKMEQGAFHLYKFISKNLTWPLMVGLGLLYIPLKDVAKSSFSRICCCVRIGCSYNGSIRFSCRKVMKMYPVESAIVTGCHSGLGGTGDVAILSASNRMELMPFAQISTRLGGAAMVVTATILLKMFHDQTS